MTLWVRDRSARVVPSAPARSARRPVVLATLEAPLTAEASAIAVDAAVETGQPLLVVNAVESSLQPCALVLGYDTIVPPDVEESLRAPADLAHSLGVEVERLRLRSPRPVDALLELVAERRARPARPRTGSVADPRAPGSARRRGGSSAMPAVSSGPRPTGCASSRPSRGAGERAEAAREERLERSGPGLRVETCRRSLDADDRRELAAASPHRRGDPREVVLALPDRVRPAARPDALDLTSERTRVGDRARRVATKGARRKPDARRTRAAPCRSRSRGRRWAGRAARRPGPTRGSGRSRR